MNDETRDDQFRSLFDAVSTLFDSLGRTLVCIDADFRVMHVSHGDEGLFAPESADLLRGLPADRLFGTDLFGERGALRRSLSEGERREGWGATLEVPGREPRQVSLSCAPIRHREDSLCPREVSYVIVVRAREDAGPGAETAPALFSGMSARSSDMRRIFELISNLSESDATVLIEGESGTGKELVARAIHAHSTRRSGRFVAVNCAALPSELLESELFGHVRGAFTGAIRDREGRFELAAGGTLLLDEIGDMPPHLQVKLLRVLQERSYERVGESKTRSSDARVVAATNRDLKEAVARGEFREDLFYRLRVVPISIPPLRQRREDIEPIARIVLARVEKRHGRSMMLGQDVLRLFLRYDWPGNVREMENALEYAVAVCPGQTIHAQDLPPEILAPDPPRPAAGVVPSSRRSAEAPREDEECRRILEALARHRWRRGATARELGMSRSTLWRRMRELGLGR